MGVQGVRGGVTRWTCIGSNSAKRLKAVGARRSAPCYPGAIPLARQRSNHILGGEKMVLPVRIELTPSALPRMRSTTELRQHCPRARRALGRAAAACQGARGGSSPKLMAKNGDREERLAAALRENLRKRKAQGRDDRPRDGEGDRAPQASGGGDPGSGT